MTSFRGDSTSLPVFIRPPVYSVLMTIRSRGINDDRLAVTRERASRQQPMPSHKMSSSGHVIRAKVFNGPSQPSQRFSRDSQDSVIAFGIYSTVSDA